MKRKYGRTLRLFLDEAGTGLELDHFLIAGAATTGGFGTRKSIRSEWERLAARFPSKSRRYKDEQLASVVDFIIKHEIHPIGAFSKMGSDRKEAAMNVIEQLPAARSMHGFSSDESNRMTAASYVYTHLLSGVLVNALLGMSLSLGRLYSVEFILDPIDQLTSFARHVITTNLSPLTGENVRARHHRTVRTRGFDFGERKGFVDARYDCCRWGRPEITWGRRDRFLDIADAYCTILRKYLQRHTPAAEWLERLRQRYQDPFAKRPASYIAFDVTDRLDGMLNTSWSEVAEEMFKREQENMTRSESGESE